MLNNLIDMYVIVSYNIYSEYNNFEYFIINSSKNEILDFNSYLIL